MRRIFRSSGSPFGLWYNVRQFAISHAEWVAQDGQRAETLAAIVIGSPADSRLITGAGRPGVPEEDVE